VHPFRPAELPEAVFGHCEGRSGCEVEKGSSFLSCSMDRYGLCEPEAEVVRGSLEAWSVAGPLERQAEVDGVHWKAEVQDDECPGGPTFHVQG